eukprot:Rmarinus@m.11011
MIHIKRSSETPAPSLQGAALRKETPYDSGREASVAGKEGRVHDPEEQFVLRASDDIADLLNPWLEGSSSSLVENVSLEFESDRHGMILISTKERVSIRRKFSVVDLPVLVESMKTIDNKMFFKSADVGQMLIVHGDGQDVIDDSECASWGHGMTPATHGIVSRRFRKKEKMADVVPHTECEVLQMIQDLCAETCALEFVEEPINPGMKLYEEEEEVIEGDVEAFAAKLGIRLPLSTRATLPVVPATPFSVHTLSPAPSTVSSPRFAAESPPYSSATATPKQIRKPRDKPVLGRSRKKLDLQGLKKVPKPKPKPAAKPAARPRIPKPKNPRPVAQPVAEQGFHETEAESTEHESFPGSPTSKPAASRVAMDICNSSESEAESVPTRPSKSVPAAAAVAIGGGMMLPSSSVADSSGAFERHLHKPELPSVPTPAVAPTPAAPGNTGITTHVASSNMAGMYGSPIVSQAPSAVGTTVAAGSAPMGYATTATTYAGGSEGYLGGGSATPFPMDAGLVGHGLTSTGPSLVTTYEHVHSVSPSMSVPAVLHTADAGVDPVVADLERKIADMEQKIAKAPAPALKRRFENTLSNLRAELASRKS